MANTLSLLVREQLPEFVRSDYDTFATFIESYYEWMDQSNNAIGAAKSLPTRLDIDTTTDQFMDYFVNQYLPLFPPDRLSNPSMMIAHAKEFYRAKGTPKSFLLLFRLLFGKDAAVLHPKNNVLRASDGEWIRAKSLRLDKTIWTVQIGDGVTTRFRALCGARSIETGDIVRVRFGGSAASVTSGTQQYGFVHSPNEPWIIFNAPPALNTIVKIVYNGEDVAERFGSNEIVLRMTGVLSDASAITESAEIIYDQLTNSLDLQVTATTGTFRQGEVVKGPWVYDTDTGASIDLYGELFSIVMSIQVVKAGYGYNVGDPVIVTGGAPTVAATAVVDEVLKAVITNISVLNGGAGYQVGQPAYIVSTPNTGLEIFVTNVDTTGNVHPNSYPINQDTINLWSHKIISNSNYYFPPSPLQENVSTRMMDAFSTVNMTGLGPIANMTIVSSTTVFTSTPQFKIDAPSIVVTGNTANVEQQNATVSLAFFGILGRIEVVTGGTGYVPGDEISFTNQVGRGIGLGGAAEVIATHTSNSGIKTIKFQPSRVTGTVSVDVVANTIQVVGTGTSFATELRVADRVEINNESTYITEIANATHLLVNVAFTKSSTGRRMGAYGRYFIGGINYSMNALPTVVVTSANGSAVGANLQVSAVLSGGESLLASGNVTPGAIVAIRVVSGGYGYSSTPLINLTGKGNGKATALAVVIAGLLTGAGYYKSTRGFLSADQHLQGAGYYYNDYSYAVRAEVELAKYGAIFKELIHPSGTKLWGEYVTENALKPAGVTANVAEFTLGTP